MGILEELSTRGTSLCGVPLAAGTCRIARTPQVSLDRAPETSPKQTPRWALTQKAQKVTLLWMDEILHHLANPKRMAPPCKCQRTTVSHGFQVVQDFVHPQYVALCDACYPREVLGILENVRRKRLARRLVKDFVIQTRGTA